MCLLPVLGSQGIVVKCAATFFFRKVDLYRTPVVTMPHGTKSKRLNVRGEVGNHRLVHLGDRTM